MTSIEDIECILKAAESHSLHKAAALLYKNPSQISRTIRKFEAEIGCDVFLRTSKGLVVTDDGTKILKCCESIIKSYHKIFSITAGEKSTKVIRGKVPFYISSMITTGIYKSISDFILAIPMLRLYYAPSRTTAYLAPSLKAVALWVISVR